MKTPCDHPELKTIGTFEDVHAVCAQCQATATGETAEAAVRGIVGRRIYQYTQHGDVWRSLDAILGTLPDNT